ncbi:MAG: phosphate regulon sensor histidine kinase PhoR [Kangiellaceae bacterium]|nr:phosphate regulon sensor histidine kinase PhoR [Kangiellaceae bacterium]
MNSAWSVEFLRILVAFVSTVLFGTVSELWTLSVVIHSTLYISWNAFQLRAFERWIRNGAPSASAPDVSGVWELIVQHIYRTQKSNKDRKRHLSKLASHYHAVMSALPDATIVLNEKLEIEWANKTSQRILGIDPARDSGHKLGNIVRDTVINDLLESSFSEDEIEMISPVDPLKHLSLAKIKYGEDKTLLIARDISQRIALQKLRKAFIANSSHELRTPLTVISGYLEMLDCDEDLPPSLGKIINNAHLQAIRMEQILNDLLVLSKLEEKGYSENSGDTVDVPALLKRLVADFQKTKAKDSHQIELVIDESLFVKAIENEFYSLCQNLLSNAVKYSPPGSAIRVCWSLTEDGKACLRVIDNGEGIADEHLSRLTERFYRVNVNRDRKVSGTGLGLSIVKHILENYGGYIDIQSELTIGSTFTACFPSYRTQQKE